MKIKKIIIPLGLSIILGYICGSVVYEIYKNKIDIVLNENKIYMLQSGAYSNIDSMKANATNKNYIYFKEDNLYKVIIGITKNEKNIEKIKNIYEGETLIIKEYNLNDKVINDEIIKYDEKLNKETEIEKIKHIVTKMLELYKENKNITISQS